MARDYTKDSKLVHQEAGSPKPPTSAGRSRIISRATHFDDLVFMTAQAARRPLDYFRQNIQPIKAKTVLGKRSKHPIEINGAAIVAAMSFGALSATAKIAIAKGATLAGTIDNTGEGGMLPEERAAAKFIIAQYSTARFGVDEEYLKSADIIEIKFGQGAKPGQGGLLPGDKVTERVAKTRTTTAKPVKAGDTLHSPPYHLDIFTVEDLKERIKWLREITDGKPIIVKIGACNLFADLPLIVEADPDIIAIDGGQGGTGASPKVMLEHTGIPTLGALIEARFILDQLRAPQELWIAGGIQSGHDMAVCLALGADAVFVGVALMQAMGCVGCGQCYKGKCPYGIATQDPELEAKLVLDEAAEKVANFFKHCAEEIKMLAGACGYDDIHKLSAEDLRALTFEAQMITGIPMSGGPAIMAWMQRQQQRQQQGCDGRCHGERHRHEHGTPKEEFDL
jgi:glutamate synthase domain-containing protein 2